MDWTASQMLKRRDVLLRAGGAALMAASPLAKALAQNAGAGAPAPAFSSTFVAEAARALAAKPFVAPNSSLPGPLNNLSADAYAAIHAKPELLVWAGDPAGFTLEPLHRGFVFNTPMQINLVEGGQARRLTYDVSKFTFGNINPGPPANLDFSGFRILQRLDSGETRELAIFQGASFFRSSAPGQNAGASARGLSICTADPRGEEFPVFRAVWIEKPTLASGTLTIHALLDSESVAGAYRFTLHPGDATIIDTECSLFPRTGIDNFGLATMSATSLFNPLDRRGDDDIREAAESLSGLQILTGAGNGCSAPSPTAPPCRFRNSSTKTRRASDFCSEIAISTISAMTASIGSAVHRCGSSRSATGARGRSNWWKFPPTPKTP